MSDDGYPHRSANEEWWLAHCALPDLVWARIRTNADGSVEVLEAGGKKDFPSLDAAESYLVEDEYAALDALREEEDQDQFLRERLGRSFKEVEPPSAETESALTSRLVQKGRGR